MKLPDSFPAGSRFVMDLTDDDGVELSYVEFPDGRRFVLNEKDPDAGLAPTTWWPLRWVPLTEAEFRSAASYQAPVLSIAPTTESS